MARVQLTQNVGPEVIKCMDKTVSAGVPTYSPTANVSKYTLHSYQVVTVQASGNVQFTIAGSNVTNINSQGDPVPSSDMEKDWITISTHTIANNSGSPATLAYSDVWNFKYSKVLIEPATTSATVEVYEKHNA